MWIGLDQRKKGLKNIIQVKLQYGDVFTRERRDTNLGKIWITLWIQNNRQFSTVPFSVIFIMVSSYEGKNKMKLYSLEITTWGYSAVLTEGLHSTGVF